MTVDLGTIITAVVTPFDAQGRVDEAATVALLGHLMDHGSDGVVACGTTGEAATLDDAEHLAVIELIVNEMRASHPHGKVIAGIGSNDTRHAAKLTAAATALGPDALLSVNPYYNLPSRRGIFKHYEVVNGSTDLPIVLYNIPQRTGADMSNDLVAELAQSFEHIIGLKQANPDNVAKIDGVQLYAGNDDLLATVLDMGGAGGILTGSHIFGDEMKRMAIEPENRAQVDASLADVYRDMAIAPAACTVKAALNMIGLSVGKPRLPYVELDDSERAVIQALLERHGMLEAASA